MHPTKISTGRGTGHASARREAWVREKGLPRACPRPLVEHLGQRILLATDLSSASHHVSARAIDVAQAAGADLLVLAVVPPEAGARDIHRRHLSALVRRARRRGIEAEGTIVAGDPADAILRMATASSAGTIIIEDSAWGGWEQAGCVSGHVLRHAPCAVLITRTPPAA